MLALDNLKGSNNYDLLAKIYSDLGDICTAQNEFKEALEKFNKAVFFASKTNKNKNVLREKINIANVYRFEKKFDQAHQIYDEVLANSTDSIISGLTLQEIGVAFLWANIYDSTVYYEKKSLSYPSVDFNRSVRLYVLSDAYYELKKLDSALMYAHESLIYPAPFHTKRECYRILANASYLLGDYKTMAGYMTYYQAYTDSVRVIDAQTKSTIIENNHENSERVSKTRRLLWVSLSFLPLLLFIGLLFYVKLQNKTKGAEVELEQKSGKLVEYEQKLHSNHEQLRNSLLFKLEEVRKREKAKSKKLTLYERQEIERKVFDECLYVEDFQAFEKLMNFTFNDILVKLNKINPDLSRNERMYCCFIILGLTNQEISLILDVQLSSLYKLKQRLAQKFNMFSSSDIIHFLRKLWLD